MSGIRLKTKIHQLIPYHPGLSRRFTVDFTQIKKHVSYWAFLVPIPPVMGDVGKGLLSHFLQTGKWVKTKQLAPSVGRGGSASLASAVPFMQPQGTGFRSHSCLNGLGCLLYLTH